eukprot:Filipodium_phascolosomae@DN1994_c0_g1_i4.p1
MVHQGMVSVENAITVTISSVSYILDESYCQQLMNNPGHCLIGCKLAGLKPWWMQIMYSVVCSEISKSSPYSPSKSEVLHKECDSFCVIRQQHTEMDEKETADIHTHLQKGQQGKLPLQSARPSELPVSTENLGALSADLEYP